MKQNGKGFTLVELFVVITIILIVATLIVTILNPVEILKRSRDAQRLEDLNSIRKVLHQALSDNPSLSLAPSGKCSDEASSTVFVSLPSDNGESNPSNLPANWSYG